MSELLREAIRLYMEEREWRRRERTGTAALPHDYRSQEETGRRGELMNDRLDLIPAALYARVSSDRQDVDLSVAAQLRALRDYAEKNGYHVAASTSTRPRAGG